MDVHITEPFATDSTEQEVQYDRTLQDGIATTDRVHRDVETPVRNLNIPSRHDHVHQAGQIEHLLLEETTLETITEEEGTHHTPELASKISQHIMEEFVVITIIRPQESRVNRVENNTDDVPRKNYYTKVQVAITPKPHHKTVACRSSSPGKSPRLMIIEALTHYFSTKADQRVTVLFDSGSQHSFIAMKTAEALGLKMKHPKDVATITFGAHEHTEKSYRVKTTYGIQRQALR